MMKVKDTEMASGETWQSILQKEFPFMQQDSKDAHNIYKTWGFECSGGWYQLLRECCEAIVAVGEVFVALVEGVGQGLVVEEGEHEVAVAADHASVAPGDGGDK